MAAYFGVYIGCCTTSVAVFKDDKVEVLANSDGDRVTPASILYNDGELSAGLNSTRYPANIIKDFKRLLCCEDLLSEEISDVIKSSQYKITSGLKDSVLFELTDTGGGKVTKRLDVCKGLQMLFKQLMETATSHSGVQGNRYAVLAVPSHFTDRKKELFRLAATEAGFKVMQIIHEPAAALLAYELGQERELPTEDLICVVYRIGGTSVDITVVKIVRGMYRVLATLHKPDLGGERLTHMLADHLADEFKRLFKVDVRSNARSVHKLRVEAETCKKVLSTLATTSCSIDSLYDGMDFTNNVSRARLDSLLNILIPEWLAPLNECLANAKLPIDSVHKVVLCGGTCKIPRVQQTLANHFPSADILFQFSPDEVVAIGAANQASYLRGFEDKFLNVASVVPMVNRNLYYKIKPDNDNAKYNVIFKEGTPVPAEIECDIPSNVEQPELYVEIYQDLGSDGVEKELLQKIPITGFDTDSGAKVLFQATKENTLAVTARELSTNNVVTVVI